MIKYIILFFIFSCTKQNLNNIDFDKSFLITNIINKKNNLLTINIKLKDNFYVYGPKEKVAKPIKLDVLAEGGWGALKEAVIPQGRLKYLSNKRSSMILEGQFSIEQPITIGTKRGEAVLHFHLCTKNLCDMPRTYAIKLEP
jgi:hypothetical protein